jgi:hypothetical protein
MTTLADALDLGEVRVGAVPVSLAGPTLVVDPGTPTIDVTIAAGPPGPPGPAGPVGPSQETVYEMTGPGSPVTVNGMDWFALPIDGAASAVPVGCAAAQSDGSVSVLASGWYHVDAAVRSDDETNTQVNVAVSTDPTPQRGGDVADATVYGWQPIVSAGGDVLLPAGGRVYVHVMSFDALPLYVDDFSLHRIGAGPPGPAGPPGVMPVNITVGPTAPASPAVGDVWIDTS